MNEIFPTPSRWAFQHVRVGSMYRVTFRACIDKAGIPYPQETEDD